MAGVTNGAKLSKAKKGLPYRRQSPVARDNKLRIHIKGAGVVSHATSEMKEEGSPSITEIRIGHLGSICGVRGESALYYERRDKRKLNL